MVYHINHFRTNFCRMDVNNKYIAKSESIAMLSIMFPCYFSDILSK